MEKFLLVILFMTAGCMSEKSDLVFNAGTIGNPKAITKTEVPTTPKEKSIKTVLSQCIGCHDDMDAEERLLNYITPGEPEKSPLFLLTEDGSMPMGGDPLPTDELEIIKDYIINLRPAADAVVTFTQLKAEILQPFNCLQCHKKMDTEESLAKWIDKSKPENSKLYLRVKDRSMPKNGRPLNTDEIDKVLNYITALTL